MPDSFDIAWNIVKYGDEELDPGHLSAWNSYQRRINNPDGEGGNIPEGHKDLTSDQVRGSSTMYPDFKNFTETMFGGSDDAHENATDDDYKGFNAEMRNRKGMRAVDAGAEDWTPSQLRNSSTEGPAFQRFMNRKKLASGNSPNMSGFMT